MLYRAFCVPLTDNDADTVELDDVNKTGKATVSVCNMATVTLVAGTAKVPVGIEGMVTVPVALTVTVPTPVVSYVNEYNPMARLPEAVVENIP